MANEAYQPATAPADLLQAAEAALRSGRRQLVTLHGKTLAIVPQETGGSAAHRGRRQENTFLAAYGSVAPLAKSLTDNEVTEVAAEEAAQDAASYGLASHACA